MPDSFGLRPRAAGGLISIDASMGHVKKMEALPEARRRGSSCTLPLDNDLAIFQAIRTTQLHVSSFPLAHCFLLPFHPLPFPSSLSSPFPVLPPYICVTQAGDPAISCPHHASTGNHCIRH